ncbi:MAG: dTDP-glucose 4,6-dehydratase [Verrucomicrobiota bacterium]
MKAVTPLRRVIVTGGAGFIGVNLVRRLLEVGHEVLNFDKLTYAGNRRSLRDVENHPRYHFELGDLADRERMGNVISEFNPDRIFHLAAESHVDRSIAEPLDFVKTNVLGTACLLESALEFWRQKNHDFRLIHVSTDEVFGSSGEGDAFDEKSRYQPSSPYSASKAGSDHLVRAWHQTYGLPTVVVNCSNNYGPYQFPEKLIPMVILAGILRNPIPVYGTGENVRDWLHVQDHCEALLKISENGRVGSEYVIGGNSEIKNIDLVKELLSIIERVSRDYGAEITGTDRLVKFVADRPGHDFRYAVDSGKLRSKLGWKPKVNFTDGLESTVRWYFENRAWWESILDGSYRADEFE